MGGDFDAGGLPELHNVGGDPVVPHGDELDARGGGEVEDVFWGPIGVIIEGENDGAPGVDGHNPVQHGGVIDLDDETVKQGGVKVGGGLDEDFKLAADGGFVAGFGVGDDIEVGVFLHQA